MSNVNLQRPERGLIESSAGFSVLSEAPYKIKHYLADHPLFEDERLRRLLRNLPREHVEIRAVQSLSADDGRFQRGELLNDVDPAEAFEQLGEKPVWMLLHESWSHDPEYEELMRQCLRELMANVHDIGEDISDLGCWIFLSSGRSVVHFHSDPDQSFLSQIRGSKTVFVYPASVLPDSAVENLLHTYQQGAVSYRAEYEHAMFPPVHIAPGEAVFLPLFAPHRVINDDEISVSFNLGFQTRESRRRRNVHLVNLELRHLGLHPSPYNRHPGIDSVKGRMHFAIRAGNKFFRSLKPEVKVGPR